MITPTLSEELNQIKTRQRVLENQLNDLRNDIRQVGARVHAHELEAFQLPPNVPSIPPVIEEVSNVSSVRNPAFAKPLSGETYTEAVPNVFPQSLAETVPPLFPDPPELPREDSSLEVSIGRNWFVRLGVVMLLTALGFFARWAYLNVVALLGPVGKVALMYGAGASLLAIGAFLERREDKLRGYAQVLVAGGFAAIYFTTFAAHFFEPLRIISNPTVAGLLLLACAGGIVVYADRRRSETTALLAVLLAYYAAALHPVQVFTLGSNLVLTLAAVFMLIRNRWTRVTVASLFASYLSYAFWDRLPGAGDRVHAPGFWMCAALLAGYWMIFTAAGLLSKAEAFGKRRGIFVTTNNALFVALTSLEISRNLPGEWWKFGLGFGALLIAMGCVAGRRDKGNVPQLYIAQGVVLLTVGLIARFSAVDLALILAAESVVLLQIGNRLTNRWYVGGSIVCAALSVIAAIAGMTMFETAHLAAGIAATVLLIFNCWVASRRDDRVVEWFFGVASVVMVLVVVNRGAAPHNLAAVLALASAGLIAMGWSLRVRGLTFLAPFLALIAAPAHLFYGPGNGGLSWSVGAVVLINQAIAHGWKKQRRFDLSDEARRAWEAIFALCAIGTLFYQLSPFVLTQSSSEWLMLSCAMAVLLTGYSVLTRSVATGVVSQVFMFGAVGGFVLARVANSPITIHQVLPMLSLLAISELLRFLTQRQPNAPATTTGRFVANIYFWTATLLGFWLLWDVSPVGYRGLVLLVAGASILLAGTSVKHQPLQHAGLLFGLAGALNVLVATQVENYLPHILVAVGWLMLERRCLTSARSEIKKWIVVIAALIIWTLASRWAWHAGGLYVTAVWSGLALAFFGAGISLRDRLYRWCGLTILAAALGRVLVFDVWQLDLVYRIVSFIALGLVLLILGYCYNRFQEKLKGWL